MLQAISIALAGGLGAAARYGVDRFISARRPGPMPWGTLFVNVSGSIALGLWMGVAESDSATPAATQLIGIGFLGAFTTFSTWMFETLQLRARAMSVVAVLNLVISVALGFGAFLVGHAIAVRLFETA